MLARAFYLRQDIEDFLKQAEAHWLRLDTNEWNHIAYLIDITRGFARMTQAVGKTRSVTSHRAFDIYNKLFGHIEKAQRQLRPKRVPWKAEMVAALKASRDKLDQYYSKTKDGLEHFYAKATLLDPSQGAQLFLTADWDRERHEIPWAVLYWNSLELEFNEYVETAPDIDQFQTDPQRPTRRFGDLLSNLLDEDSDEEQETMATINEFEKYRCSGTSISDNSLIVVKY